jgi:hypothetical protein
VVADPRLLGDGREQCPRDERVLVVACIFTAINKEVLGICRGCAAVEDVLGLCE